MESVFNAFKLDKNYYPSNFVVLLSDESNYSKTGSKVLHLLADVRISHVRGIIRLARSRVKRLGQNLLPS